MIETSLNETRTFIDLNSDNYYDFKDGLVAISTGRLSVKSYHTNTFDKDLQIGTKVIAGWSAKRSHPAIILDVLHKFYDCGQTRYTFYKLRRTE